MNTPYSSLNTIEEHLRKALDPVNAVRDIIGSFEIEVEHLATKCKDLTRERNDLVADRDQCLTLAQRRLVEARKQDEAQSAERDRWKQSAKDAERTRWDIEKILDQALGTAAGAGSGAGLVGDVALLAEHLTQVRSERDDLEAASNEVGWVEVGDHELDGIRNDLGMEGRVPGAVRGKVAWLRQRNDELEDTAGALTAARRERDEFEHLLRATEKVRDRMRDERDTAVGSAEHLREDLERTHADVRHMRVRGDEFKAACAERDKLLVDRETTIAGLERRLRDAFRQRDDAFRNRDTAVEQVQQLTGDLTLVYRAARVERDAPVSRLAEVIHTMDRKAEQAERLTVDLNAAYGAAGVSTNRDAVVLTQTIDEIRAERDDLKTKVRNMSNQWAAETIKYGVLRDELAVAQTRAEDLRKGLASPVQRGDALELNEGVDRVIVTQRDDTVQAVFINHAQAHHHADGVTLLMDARWAK